MSIRFKIDRGYMTLTGIQAPEEGRTESTNTFYVQLQEILRMIITGAFNDHVRKVSIKNICGNERQDTVDNNGK
jgi:hypothetical protein